MPGTTLTDCVEIIAENPIAIPFQRTVDYLFKDLPPVVFTSETVEQQATCTVVGVGCATAGTQPLSLSCNSVPLVGTSFAFTLSGNQGVGGMLAEFAPLGGGIPLPTPLFAPGCTQYVSGGFVVLGLAVTPSQQFAINIPAGTAFAGLPIGLQGAAVAGGQFTASNGLDSRIGTL
ncbi:MAG: hypothetical protein KDC98_04275 [Planctomycetes bacterium]|nr:hypothetical protein [Planctomycetota bacterium]